MILAPPGGPDAAKYVKIRHFRSPPGGAKIMCFYVFCCIWAPWGTPNHAFSRMLLHPGLPGQHKSCVFASFAAWGLAFGSTGAVWAILGTPGGYLGAQRGALGRSWGLLGTPWAVLGTILGTFGDHLDPPWGPFGAFWIRLGRRCDS